MTHYHIRWSDRVVLDWQAFSSRGEAEERAKELVRSGETYDVEERDGDCPRCKDAAKVKSARQ